MVKSINSKEDARRAEARIDKLVSRNDLSFKEEEELNILSILLTNWEDENVEFPESSKLDLVETIKFMMDQHGLSKQNDLVGPVFANKVRASEVFNSKRSPTLSEIKKLNEFLRIPYELLIR